MCLILHLGKTDSKTKKLDVTYQAEKSHQKNSTLSKMPKAMP